MYPLPSSSFQACSFFPKAIEFIMFENYIIAQISNQIRILLYNFSFLYKSFTIFVAFYVLFVPWETLIKFTKSYSKINPAQNFEKLKKLSKFGGFNILMGLIKLFWIVGRSCNIDHFGEATKKHFFSLTPYRDKLLLDWILWVFIKISPFLLP